jgi:hypothetical protein
MRRRECVLINAQMSGFGGEAEFFARPEHYRVLTQLRRRPVFLTAAKSARFEHCL